MKLSEILKKQEEVEGLTDNIKLLKILSKVTTDGYTWNELTTTRWIGKSPNSIQRRYANDKLIRLVILLKNSNLFEDEEIKGEQ